MTRHDGEAALIKMPSENVVPGRRYEIRDVEREAVLAEGVSGQDLLDARRAQPDGYLEEDAARSNIAMVDVAALTPAPLRVDEAGTVERSRFALPEQQYLARIGEVAYTVSSMEWTILGDLHRLTDRLPENLVLKRLEPMMTSGIAGAVKDAATAVDDGPIKDYLTEVYRALYAAAEIRSDVLHARPATHPAQGQRLNRAETRNSQTTGKRFWVDDEWFDAAISKLNEKLSAVARARPPFS